MEPQQPAASYDYRQQVGDMFALASAHRFTGDTTINWKDGQPRNIVWVWKSTFGEQAARFIRILRGRPPPGPS